MTISDSIKYVGVNDHDIDLFEGQYVVPNGMAYNSYVVLGGEKSAVMDTVDARFGDEWLANVKAALGALGEGTAEGKKGGGADGAPSPATVAALAVLVAAAVLPLFPRTRGKGWRTALLVLDVAVLGVWNGLFLSLDRLLGWAASGLPGTPADAAAALLLLAMGFLYPLAGKSSHYCLHVCPFGACQELAARLPVKRLAVPPGVARALSWARRGLWAGIMLSLWCGLAAPWTGWELFGAFAWRAVPPLVAALAVGAVAVSAFVPRAYCRFACPTGTLLKIAESRE